MFIFAAEIASLFTFYSLFFFPSLCFLGFHNNTKTLSIVPWYFFNRILVLFPLFPPSFWLDSSQNENKLEPTVGRTSFSKEFIVRIASCDQIRFFQGTSLQSSHFPSFFSLLFHRNISQQANLQAGGVGRACSSSGSSDRRGWLRTDPGASGALWAHSMDPSQALESVLAFTGCPFWQCLLMKKVEFYYF